MIESFECITGLAGLRLLSIHSFVAPPLDWVVSGKCTEQIGSQDKTDNVSGLACENVSRLFFLSLVSICTKEQKWAAAWLVGWLS